MEIVDPSGGQALEYEKEEIDRISRESAAEFGSALRIAMAMLEQSTGALKHLLILTAGPVYFYGTTGEPGVEWDSTIAVSLLSSYVQSGNSAAAANVAGFA